MRENDNKKKDDSPSEQNPVGNAPEVRIVGTIILACFGAILVALTFKFVRWIIGF